MTLNFHHICRLCLERDECLLPLFEEECILPSKINNLIPTLKVHFGDGLPAQICTHCAQQVNASFTFKLRCEGSDATLRQQISVAENCLTVTKIEELDDRLEPHGHDESFVEAEHWLPAVKIEVKEFEAERNDNYAATVTPSQEQEICSPVPRKIVPDKDSTKTFSCNECGTKFLEQHVLVQHACSHHKKIPHSYTQCEKDFQLSNTLKKFKQSQKPVRSKPHTCSECGKSFHHSHILKEHERVHTGERPYSCTICGKSFAKVGNVTNHMRSHTGVRPFLCTICGRRFGFSSTLSKHMMTHTSDRPYVCPECGKGFSLTYTLKKHLLTHTGEKPFACQECGKRFNRKDHLKCHFRKTHLTYSEPLPAENCVIGSSVSEPLTLPTPDQSIDVQQNTLGIEVYSDCLSDPGSLIGL